MKPALYSRIPACKALTACLLLLVVPLAGGFDEEDAGWSPQKLVEPAPWQEQAAELPAYPEQERLLEVAINTEGQPYRIYIDPASLTMGADQIARYAVVISSSSGVWNVSYEGLHCGERAYRRYAYGFDGEWQRLEDSPWMPITGIGMNRYRKTFYNVYMCPTAEPFQKAGQVLWKLRFGNPVLYD
jgi:hypothetical protein